MKQDRNPTIVTKYLPVPNKQHIAPNWRPWPIRAPILLVLTAICVLLILVIELLIRSCSPDECPVLGKSPHTSVPAITTFVYNYLPTIIGIGFGLMWASVQHDYNRMEPWFQLSKPGGATARESLLAKYPYKFPLLVPIEAARLRHYTVLISSVIFLFVTLVLTPITSGMLDQAFLAQNLHHETAFSALPWLGPEMATVDRQLTTSFAYLAYSYAWLNGSLPAFTIPQYALAPWVSGDATVFGQNESWTGNTMVYEVDLECEEAQRIPIVLKGVGTVGYNLTSTDAAYYGLWDYGVFTQSGSAIRRYKGNRGIVGDVFESEVTWNSRNIKPNTNSTADMRLLIWGNTPDPDWKATPGTSTFPKNWTAIFCSPKYYMEPATATALMPSGEVTSILRYPEPERATERVQINRSPRLEYLFSNLLPQEFSVDDEKFIDDGGNIIGFGYPPQQLPFIGSQLRERFGTRKQSEDPLMPYTKYQSGSMISVSDGDRGLESFALYSQRNETLPDLLHWENLAEMYRQAFKVLFSALCADSQVSQFRVDVPTTTTRKFQSRGYQVNLTWSRAAQGGLALVALLTVVLAVLGWDRRCNLDGEPHSLAAGLGLLERSPKIVEELQHAEFHDPQVLKAALLDDDKRYYLHHCSLQGPRIEVDKTTVVRQLPPSEKGIPYKSPDEWPTSAISGVSIEVFFALLLGLLVFVLSYDKANDGLPTIFTPNSLGYKIIYSYLPTILGLAVEPLLVTLASYHCMLGPYKALLRRNSPSHWPLALDYDKSPPQFQVLRSLRARDITLSGLGLAVLLSNVLAIALAGLFYAKTSDTTIELQATSFGTPVITGWFTVPAQEMYYRLSSGLLGGLPVPSWTTPGYYILPVSLPARDEFLSVDVPTLGLGSSISCSLLPDSAVITYCTESGEKTLCSTGPSYNLVAMDSCWNTYTEGGPVSLRWGAPARGEIEHSTTCPNTCFVIWADPPSDPSPSNLTVAYTSAFESVVLRCTSSEVAVSLTATVDSNNSVLGVDNVVPLTADQVNDFYPAQFRLKNTVHLVPTFFDMIQLGAKSEGGGLNILMWVNYLMVAIYPSIRRDLGSRISHIPDRAGVVQAFEDVYKRLYAVNLRLYADDVLGSVPGSAVPVPAIAKVSTERVTVSMPMFLLAVIILLYLILLWPFLYQSYAGREITHKPTSLIGMWTALYASNVKVDCAGIRGWNPDERAKRLGEMGYTYSYGRFPGEDMVDTEWVTFLREAENSIAV